MELLEVADLIQKLIKLIGECRREIEAKGKAKAKAISNYSKKLAIAESVLRNTETYELSGKTYKQPPVSILKDIAKGICCEEEYEKEIAESGYKACISNLEALKSQVNAYQSIFRWLDET